MNLGEKIKQARISQNKTQADLAKDTITRNMLSAIECGKATPSLDTLIYIAKELDIPITYLLADDDYLFFYEKQEKIKHITEQLRKKNYTGCINAISKFKELDDELHFLLAQCYYELGISSTKNGALKKGMEYLDLCTKHCESTVYDTTRFESSIPLYRALVLNIKSPLLEFEEETFLTKFNNTFEYEFYRYVLCDFNYTYTNEIYSLHIEAKKYIKERKYNEALKLLLRIEDIKSDYEYNSYVMFGVYGDLDYCYKQICNFESAYRYSSKRISLLESFQT